MASNMLELAKSKFDSMNTTQITETAKSAVMSLVDVINPQGDNSIQMFFSCVEASMRIGFNGKGFSAKQKQYIKEVFATFYQAEVTQEILDELLIIPGEQDYKILSLYNFYGIQMGRAMFELMMCSAYIDGSISDAVAEKIDPIFGMVLLGYFMDSGLESVPAPRQRVTGLEAKVLDYMLKKKNMMPLNEIARAFPGESKAAVKKALDGLCEKDLVHWLFNVIGEPYSADVDREDVEIVLTETNTKTPSSPKKSEAESAAEKKREEEKAKAEAEKKAEAERKVAEKKAAEEKEKKAYEKALGDWKQAVQKTETARKNELSRRRKAQEKTLTEKYQKEYEAAKSAANKAKKAAEDKKKKAEETLASLGVFKFGEKKAQRALIAEAEAEIAAAEQAKEAAAAAHTQAIAGMADEMENYVASQTKAVEKQFPIPAEPKKPKVILEEERMAEEKRKEEELAAQKKAKATEDENLTRTIPAVMEYGKYYRLSEIKALIPELAGEVGTQHTAALCRKLEAEGILEKFVDNRIIYYSLAD